MLPYDVGFNFWVGNLGINVHFRKIGLPVLFHHPEPRPLIETHNLGPGISSIPTAEFAEVRREG